MPEKKSEESWRAACEKWAAPAAFGIAALFFAAMIFVSARRLFWSDEVFTTLSTRLPDWASVWQAATHSADTMSFGYLAIARIFDHWFGPGEIGIRLPSVLAVTLGLLLTFDCARRFSDGWHGLIAMAALLCSFAARYGHEGRAYGVYFLFAALSLWCWTTRRSSLLLGFIFLGGVLIHYYMVFCLVPLAAAEALERRSWRIFSAPLMSGAAGALLAIGLLWPQISYARTHLTPTFWASPTASDLAGSYEKFFPLAPLLIATVLIGAAVLGGHKSTIPDMTRGERTAWLFLAIPFAAYVAAKLVTNAYMDRYVISVLPGAAVGTACLAHRLCRGQFHFSAAILVLLLAAGGWRLIGMLIHAETGVFEENLVELKAILQTEDEIWRDGKRFIVTPETRFFLPARYYSAHPERYIAIPGHPANETRYFPLPKWSEQEVAAHSRECALVAARPDLIEDLRRAGLHLTIRKAEPLVIYFE